MVLLGLASVLLHVPAGKGRSRASSDCLAALGGVTSSAGGRETVRFQARVNMTGVLQFTRGLALLVLTLTPLRASVRILPLGDSITHGDSAHSTYRRVLWHTLTDAGYAVDFVGSQNSNTDGPTPNPDFDLDHEGHWGWRADEIRDSLAGWLTGYTPDIVLLHIGSNDAFQNSTCNGGDFLSCTVDEIKSIIDLLRADNAHVVVLLAKLIPALDATANARVSQLNGQMDSIAAAKTTADSPVIVVDQNTSFSAATDTYDGVHPNSTGESKMSQRWAAALRAVLPGLVLQRLLFYNNSAWDGGDALVNDQDDLAIATDKVALRPSQTATFANYSSFSGGITGVMIDLALPGTPGEDDLILRVGRSNDTAQWQTAPPPSITVRANKGDSGSDRLTLTWADGVIQQEWLQVTVLATANTGLVESDTFYFGNAIGETGNSNGDAKVTSADALAALNNITASAAVNNPYDHNRDKRVGSADTLISLQNLSAIEPLPLITAASTIGVHGPETASQSSPSLPAQNRGEVLLWMERVGSNQLQLRVLDPSSNESLRILKAARLKGEPWEVIPPQRIQKHPNGGLVLTISDEENEKKHFFRAERDGSPAPLAAAEETN